MPSYICHEIRAITPPRKSFVSHPFRAAGYFIGSGVVEAGCKTVIGARCKQSGMFWSEAGAENILALRCINRSRRLDEFWKHRLNVLAASNDTLPLKAAA